MRRRAELVVETRPVPRTGCRLPGRPPERSRRGAEARPELRGRSRSHGCRVAARPSRSQYPRLRLPVRARPGRVRRSRPQVRRSRRRGDNVRRLRARRREAALPAAGGAPRGRLLRHRALLLREPVRRCRRRLDRGHGRSDSSPRRGRRWRSRGRSSAPRTAPSSSPRSASSHRSFRSTWRRGSRRRSAGGGGRRCWSRRRPSSSPSASRASWCWPSPRRS